MMSSASPSQLSAFASSNLYSQAPPTGLSNINLQQRGISNPQFQRRNITPTSMAPTFPLNLQQQQQQQQQSSPNSRNMFSLDQRNILSRMQQSNNTSLNSQLKRSNAITSSLMSSQVNTATSGTFPSFSRSQSENQPSLDLSDFPTLTNRSAPAPSLPTPRNYVGMVSKPVQEPTPEFQIQQEEFPALPSAQNPPTSSSINNEISPKTVKFVNEDVDGGHVMSAIGLLKNRLFENGHSYQSVDKPSNSPSLVSYEQALSRDGAKFPGDKSATNQSQQRRGIQTHTDGTVSNIPPGMVTDQFGMVGLLTFIRAAETDPNLVALAPGIDLTTLGLNLNSPENLYSTFQSPWADAPCRPQDIDFHVPQEYLTNIFIRDKLAPIKLNRYGDDLLFFLFYMNGGDVLQLAAAAELYTRDWRYHKEERVWMTRVPGLDPQMKTTAFERGTYYFFDAQNWRKVAKDFRLEYDKLEDRPQLPPTIHPNPNPNPTLLAH